VHEAGSLDLRRVHALDSGSTPNMRPLQTRIVKLKLLELTGVCRMNEQLTKVGLNRM